MNSRYEADDTIIILRIGAPLAFDFRPSYGCVPRISTIKGMCRCSNLIPEVLDVVRVTELGSITTVIGRFQRQRLDVVEHYLRL
jgi:hypothetical protein